MITRTSSALAAFALSLLCFACGGGGGGGNGPTQPPGPTGKRFQFSVTAAPGNFEGNILEGAVAFDGQEVGRVDWSRTSASGCFFPCEVVADVQGIPPGNHTVRFTVVRQQRPTMLYSFILNGFIIDPATGSREQVSRVSERLRLRAGEGVNFTIGF